MSYALAIDPSEFEFCPTSEPMESILQIPHEGNYNNSEQFEALSKQQLAEKPGVLITQDDPLRETFREKVIEWKLATRGISSVSEIVSHPAYQWIMAKGERALPWILNELRQNGGEWFHALYYIRGQDEAAGTKTVADATAAWLEWGYRGNYI